MWEAEISGRIKLPSLRTSEETIELARTARDNDGNWIVPRELFAVEYADELQASMDDCCVIITSLSLLPHHIAVQSTCLNSWKRAGFTIHCKNRKSEVARLKHLYPQVSGWHECEKVQKEYAKPTQSIHALIQTAVEIDQTVLLVNSDIEIHGKQQVVRDAIGSGVLVGIRHDYDSDKRYAVRFAWGLDAFSFTPSQAKRLPYLPFGIGKPVWDYWLPQHWRSIGMPMNFIGEPFFFHKKHKLNWSEAEWLMGAEWFYQQYGFMRSQAESVVFRQSLPYPPYPYGLDERYG